MDIMDVMDIMDNANLLGSVLLEAILIFTPRGPQVGTNRCSYYWAADSPH